MEYANKTLLIAREHNNRLIEKSALTSLKEAYSNMGQTKKVNFYLEQIAMVKDSINKYNRLKELYLLALQYQYDEDKKQFELKQKLLENELRHKELIYALIILGTGLVIIVLVFLY